VQGLVPEAILNRPKQGFGLPLQQWINQELRDYIRDTLTDRRARERGYFNPRYIDLLFDEHSRNRRDHSKPLWTLFMLELWHRAYCEQATPGDLIGSDRIAPRPQRNAEETRV
jgi:asparagine synthase (glutamine-hydrolysing)